MNRALDPSVILDERAGLEATYLLGGRRVLHCCAARESCEGWRTQKLRWSG
jgi:hypothetical protein